MSQQIPVHGGDLVSASEQYSIAIDQWIDLSTGINPITYPVVLELNSFQQLPYIRPEFIEASTQYYECSQFIPVSGTQAAIQQLPKLLADFPVLIPKLGYQEHVKYWQEKRATIIYYGSDKKDSTVTEINQALADNPEQHLVVINPNNPTGVLIDKEQLLNWAGQLARQAYLIIDEAFIDTHKEQSVLSESLPDNIIVLRSFGKFFGLAGVRLGYCFANKTILAQLQKKLGLWQVNGPAQSLAIKALGDNKWQMQALKDIRSNNQLMQKLWEPLFDKYSSQDNTTAIAQKYPSPLFITYKLSMGVGLLIRDYFAKRGILLRIITIGEGGSQNTKNAQALLRIGLIDQHDKATLSHVTDVIDSFVNDSNHNEMSNV